MLRYKLRTLLIVLALGPPVLAGVWLAPNWLMGHPEVATGLAVVLFFALAAGVYVVVTFGAGWIIAWAWNTTAEWIEKLCQRKQRHGSMDRR